MKDSITAEKVAWGKINQPFEPEKFDAIFDHALEHLRGKELFVQDLYAGADPKYRMPIRVINEWAWQNLFVRAMFVRPSTEELKTHKPEFTIVGVPSMFTDPKRDGSHSGAFIAVNFSAQTGSCLRQRIRR